MKSSLSQRPSSASAAMNTLLVYAMPVAFALLIAVGQATGRLSGQNLILAVGLPIVIALGIFAPRWVLLLLLAIPPGYLLSSREVNVNLLTMMLWMLIGLQMIPPVRLPGRSLLYLSPLIGMIALMVVHKTNFSADIAVAAADFRATLLYAISLGIFSYMLTRNGEIPWPHLADALLVGVSVTALVFLVQNNFQPWAYTPEVSGDPLQIGLLGYRTHFGYLMSMGVCVAIARATNPSGEAERPPWVIPITIFLGLMTLVSLTRGAWLAVIVYLLVLPLRTGKRHLWLILLGLMVVALSIPLVQERLVSDVSGGVTEAVRNGDIGTGRWGLWQELWDRIGLHLPWGGGFGYTFSLKPEQLLGFAAFTTEQNEFVYPHNDFLYVLLDFGIAGFMLLAAQWAVVVRIYRRAAKVARGWVFGGVLITMLIASLVDNGLFIRPLLERCLIIVGFLAAASIAQRGEETSVVEAR